MRVVVTGATSMIGIALIKECLKKNVEVLAIIRKESSRIKRLPKSDLIKIEYADIDSLSLIHKTDMKYDVFYHLAWSHTTKAERDCPLLQEENIQGTLQAVALAHRLGCKKFVGAGSQAEYGYVKGVITETTKTNPVIAYGIAKLSAYMLSKRMCEQYGMVHIWGRIFSVYGIYDNEGTMLNYAIDQFIRGEVACFSSAIQKWNYLNEIDAGVMLYLFGEKNVESGIYCIANNESRVLREYIEVLQKEYGPNARCEFENVDSEKEVVELEVDMSKTIDAISYVPQISFQIGVRMMIENCCGKNN